MSQGELVEGAILRGRVSGSIPLSLSWSCIKMPYRPLGIKFSRLQILLKKLSIRNSINGKSMFKLIG